ncbi:hypothetical protein [Actinocatenispora rupis]|uniref:Uncharacterized protein n=1 Tax=Actinocatenispora rupis TaxID=519421 RepID=A0A8J3J403_9ACTN|nr:hypothetical protein [Actinocatenispora rupis]GID11537.1 hypothetical protein Aru02nite_24260 [Actinocatenispora rupis]
MSVRLAYTVVRAATRLVPDPAVRERYREQWFADLDGAAELGLTPARVSLGMAVAAVRLAAADRRGLVAVATGALHLRRISDRARRRFAVVQIVAVAPYLYTLGLYVVGRVSYGMTRAQMVTDAADPKGLFVFGLWNPFAWPFPLAVYYQLFAGWYAATVLVPFGLLLAVGARRRHRVLLLAASLAAVAVTVVGATSFGADLRTWILD